MKWFIHVLKNIFTYTGRARRAEFGWFTLTNFLIQMGVYIGTMFIIAVPVAASFGQKPNESVLAGVGIFSMLIGAALMIYQVVVFLASISLTTRRLHDLGLSGWWQLLFYVLPMLFAVALIFWAGTLPDDVYASSPEYLSLLFGVAGLLIGVIYLIFLLILLFKDGQRRTNRFGEDPKAVELAALLKVAQSQANICPSPEK